MDANLSLTVDKDKDRVKYGKILVWASFFFYVLMMGSKNVFTAEIVTLQGIFGTSKTDTSLAMTYYFITYAIAQVVLSTLMGKLNLRIYLTVTGVLSALVTVLLGVFKDISITYVLCAINGILQAGIYSGCMACISKYLPLNMLPFANRMMTIGTAVWGALSYGIPPLFVGQGLWNVPFILLGVLFFISALFFFWAFNKMRAFPPVVGVKKDDGNKQEEKPFINLKGGKSIAFYFALMFFITFLGNTMHYAVMNWIPNMMKDVFGMPDEYSILITLIVPVVSVVGSVLVISLCEKFTNIIWVSAAFLAIAVISLVPMVFFFDKNIILSIVLIIIFVTATTGGRTVFTGILAFKMRTRINSGSYLAAINAIAAVCAGVIPPLAGKVIDAFTGVKGYGVTYLITAIIGVIYLLTLVIFATWYARKRKKH